MTLNFLNADSHVIFFFRVFVCTNKMFLFVDASAIIQQALQLVALTRKLENEFVEFKIQNRDN
jgi:hypothetical protein